MIRVNRLGVFVPTEGPEPVQSEACFSFRTVFSNSFWRIAVLTAAEPSASPRRRKPRFIGRIPTPDFRGRRRRCCAATAAKAKSSSPSGRPVEKRHRGPAVKEAAKPQGPLVIAISINKQNMKIYDANGFFAETPISTGMRGHPTPMGVFSVIQKRSCTIPTSTAARRCPLCSGSRGQASPSTPACFPAIRHHMAASACRWPSP